MKKMNSNTNSAITSSLQSRPSTLFLTITTNKAKITTSNNTINNIIEPHHLPLSYSPNSAL